MKRVCHITTVHGPFDDRIFFKQCRSLAAAGFDTVLVAPIAEGTVEDRVRIVPVRVPASRFLRATFGAWRAYRTAKAERADLYQVHDPALMWVARLWNRRSTRVVVDMHESMREHILTKSWLGPKWRRRSIASLYNRFEDRVMRRCDAVLVVVPHMAEDLKARHAHASSSIHVIRNLPVLAIVDGSTAAVERTAGFVLAYAGGLSRLRGIREVVLALEHVPEARLKLLGRWDSPEYRSSCSRLPGWSQVIEGGLVRMDAVYDHLRSADAGLCLLHPVHNYMISAPIKAYEYMACRLPMLMSDFPAWREQFGDHAWFADPLDPRSIVSAVQEMMAAPEQCRRKGASGRKAVVDGSCWEQEAGRLIDLYRQLTA